MSLRGWPKGESRGARHEGESTSLWAAASVNTAADGAADGAALA